MTKDYVLFVNRGNLRIARENMGLDFFAASKKITTSKRNYVKEWEEGASLPKWSQLIKLAKAYNISELALCSKEEIQKNKKITDFRVEIKDDNNEKVNKLINIVSSRQRWLERKMKEDGLAKNKLVGFGRDIDDPIKLAKVVADELDFNLQNIINFSGNDAKKKALKYLTEKVESKGIFVGKTISYIKVDVEDLRGLSISNDYCPFIVINRSDSVAAQIFSLVHEVTHVFRKSDAISNSLEFRKEQTRLDPEERICNSVAAELLLPESEFTKPFYDRENIYEFAEKYKASPLFVLYRMKELGKLGKGSFSELENSIRTETNRNLEEKKKLMMGKSGGSFINNMKDSNGNLFNNFVSSAYFEKKIGFIEAANLLKYSPEQA